MKKHYIQLSELRKLIHVLSKFSDKELIELTIVDGSYDVPTNGPHKLAVISALIIKAVGESFDDIYNPSTYWANELRKNYSGYLDEISVKKVEGKK